EDAGHVVGTDHAPGKRRRLATAIRNHLDVWSEQFPQSVEVTVSERIEEPRSQLLAFAAVRLEPRARDRHVASRPDRELAASHLRPPDGNCDLGKAESEHLPQHK